MHLSSRCTTVIAGSILALASAAALADSKPVIGTYTLPMPAELADLTSYPLTTATLRVEDQLVVVDYDMPEDLTGEAHYSMTMVGDANEMMTSEFFPMVCHRTGSTATCARSGNGIACTLQFRNLGLSPERVNAFLDQKYGVSAETERRKRASATVQSDAVGTLFMVPRDSAH
jgi:hypothetical protein